MANIHPGVGDPLVTVVIPTHDRIGSAGRAVTSVLAQTVGDLEVIVVDDGSEPPFVLGTPDPRVRLVRSTEAGGVTSARNVGLREARGRWIVFLDDDDELLPDMLEGSLEAVASSSLPPPVAVLSGITVVDERGRTIEHRRPTTLPRGARYFLEQAGTGGYRCDRTLVAPVSVVRAIGGFDERYRASEDKDFFLRLNAVCSLHGLGRDTYRKTEHDGPSLRTDPVARAHGIALTLDKHADEIAGHPAAHALMLGAMCMALLGAGRWRPAVSAAIRAVGRNPRRARHYLQLGAAIAGPTAFAAARRLRRAGRLGPRAGPGRSG